MTRKKFEAPLSFHGRQNYLEVHPSQFLLRKVFFFIKGVLNIKGSNMTADKIFEAIYKCIYIYNL
jgi:hypothetical protein